MNNAKLYLTIVISAVFMALGLLVHRSLNQYWQKKIQVEERKLLIEAVYSCGQVTSATWRDAEGTQVTEPYRPAYEKCLRDKGY